MFVYTETLTDVLVTEAGWVISEDKITWMKRLSLCPWVPPEVWIQAANPNCNTSDLLVLSFVTQHL